MSQLVRSAQRVIPAPAAEVFDLLAQPRRHHEVDGSGSVSAEVEGPQRLSRGDAFRVVMHRGPLTYRSNSSVVEFEERRRIAWRTATDKGGHLVFGGQVWRYELTDRGDGTTLVRESWDITHARPRVLLERIGGSVQQEMVATLDRMAEHFA